MTEIDFAVTTSRPEGIRSDCLIVLIGKGTPLSSSARDLDSHCEGQIQQLIDRGDLLGDAGETAWIHHPQAVRATRLLLVGCGENTPPTNLDLAKGLTAMTTQLINSGCKAAHLMTDSEMDQPLQRWCRLVIKQCTAAHYHYLAPGSPPPAQDRPKLKRITFTVTSRSQANQIRQAITEGSAIAAGTILARTLGNLPANICTPDYLARQAQQLVRNQKQMQSRTLNEAEMKKLGMGALLAVAQGADRPAKMIICEYHGAPKNQPPTVLVGKGVTFDSGGISLKPGARMDEMKFDMCGAAAVLGTLLAVRQLELPLNLIGIIPATENLPSGKATRPGDVVTSMSGTTIEILNTDAEGRLILCDALSYAERFKPDEVIDIATLTGACVVALGKHASGLLSNDDGLATALLAAGEESGDRAWRLPLWSEYQPQLDSNFADLANIGGPEAGTITAACFLSRFVEKQRWAHLDIAGTAWLQGKEKGATGRPVALLVQHLLNKVTSG